MAKKLFCIYVKQVSFNELYLEAESEEEARDNADTLLMNGNSTVLLGDSDEHIESVEEQTREDDRTRYLANAKENAEALEDIRKEGQD